MRKAEFGIKVVATKVTPPLWMKIPPFVIARNEVTKQSSDYSPHAKGCLRSRRGGCFQNWIATPATQARNDFQRQF